VTEAERIDRQTLLARAVGVAGATYLAPVLTSAAGASTSACPAKRCVPGHPKKGDQKCAKRSWGNIYCKCDAGTSRCKEGGSNPCSGCVPPSQRCCGPVVPCGGCGDGACFCDFNGTGCVCIKLWAGNCAGPQPCGPDGSCPAGQFCFKSCCPEPLCRPSCSGASGVAPLLRSVTGPMPSVTEWTG
jgi:hypothetical protein